jgi:CHAT domain-containing protein/nitrous oxidase accessory protein NosD
VVLLLVGVVFLGGLSATITVPDDYPTIQEAIYAANPGDTVLIASGSYVEQLLIGKDITLQGDCSGVTSLDAQGGSAITINSGVVAISDVAFLHGGENVTILNPHVFGDGALSIRGDSYVLVRRCAFGQSEMGVAIRDQSKVVLSDCSFENVDLPVLVAEAARCSLIQCTTTQSKWAVEVIGAASIDILRSHLDRAAEALPVRSETLCVPSDYPTIQAAIDAAETGDTVLIASGSYVEQLLIGKDITLQGDCSGVTSLDAQGGSAVTINSGVVAISDVAFLHSGENVAFFDSHVFRDGAMLIRGDSYALVQRCTFEQSEMGVAIRDQSNVVLSDCSFENVDLPVLVAEAARCSLTQCTMSQSEWVIRGIGDASIDILRSHIEDFVYVGLLLSSNAEALVRETTIVPPGRWAVKIDGRAQITMRQCQVKPGPAGEMFSREAIEATDYAYVEIYDSELEGGEDSLLRLKLAAEALLVQSQLMGETQNAVYLSDESSIQINGCAIQGARESSVWLTEESRARIVSCQFLDSEWGVALSGAAEATLVDSTLTGTTQDAIRVREQAIVHLFDCEISEALNGLDVQEEAVCQFVGGVITNCSMAGVRVKGNASVEVTSAVVSGNYGGIIALDNATLSVFQTEVCMNDYGIRLGCQECVDPAPAVEYAGLVLGRGNSIRDNEEINLCPDEQHEVWPAGFASVTAISVPHDYELIQDAIDAALPGDVILIEAGLYQERLTIAKPISLEAVGVGPTILVPPEWSGVLIEVKPGCGGIWISDLEFRAASHAIEACLQAGDSLHLQGVTVFSAGRGIAVQGDGCLVAENAHIGYVAEGILIEDITAVIRDCSFINQELRAGVLFNGDGVVLIGDVVTSISDNLFINFGVPISVRLTRTTGATTEIPRFFTGSVSGHDNSGDYDWAALLPMPWDPNAPWPSDFFDLGFREQSSRAEQHMFAGLNALFGDGDSLEGVALFEDALTILRKTRHPILEAQVLYFLSMAEHAIGRNIEATEHYVRALYLSKQYYFDLISISLVEHAGDAMTHRYFEGLGQLTDAFKTAWSSFYRARRDAELLEHASALEEAEEARVTLEEILENSDEQSWVQELLWQVLLLLGDLHVQIGQNEEALASYQQAARVIESVSINISSEDIRLFWYERTREVYERLVDLLFQMGEGNLAFPYVERCRARTFLDLLAMGPVGTLENVAEEGIRSGVVDTSVIEKDLAEVVAGLPEDTAVLEYFVTEETVYLWVVTQDGVSEPIPIEIGREVLIDRIVSFRKMLETPPTGGVAAASFALLSAARDLFELLIGPVEEKIAGFSHLVIVPSGPLYYLPFSALYRCPGCAGRDLNGGEFLVERFALSYAPSLTTLKYAQAIGAQIYPERTFLGLADPDSGNPTIHRLPDARKEAESIAALFLRSEVYVDVDATEEVIQSCSATAREILFSTHGYFDPLNPMLSYLLLSPTGESDGKLYAHEIFSLPLRANMVVLSACETLLPSLAQMTDQLNKIARRAGDDTPQELTEEQLMALTAGDEVVGLTRAFISAGASSVLSSLWSVPSGSTAALMVAFYGHMDEGLSKAEALRRAQMDVKEVYPHPWYWAAFNLMGDWR